MIVISVMLLASIMHVPLQEPDQAVNDIGTPRVSTTLENANKTIIDYDMEWKDYKQTKVIDFSPRLTTHYTNDFRKAFSCGAGPTYFYRVIAYRSEFEVINATSNDFGRNLTRWDDVSLGTSYDCFEKVFEVNDQQFRFSAVKIDGGNASNIQIDLLLLNNTGAAPAITTLNTTIIHAPTSLTSISNILIANCEAAWYDSTIIDIHGKYVNDTTDIPFIYTLDYSGTSVTVTDTMQLNTTSHWMNFDDIILKVRNEAFGNYYIITNQRFLYTDIPQTANFYINESLPFTLPYSLRNDFSNFGAWETPGDYYEDLAFVVVTKLQISPTIDLDSTIIRWNKTGIATNPNVEFINVQYGILSRVLTGNTILSTTPDFSDGNYVFGLDHDANVWNTYSISTGDPSPFLFDVYFPYDILYITASEVELIFADSRGLWIAQFTSSVESIYGIGTVDFDYVQISTMEIEHRRGVDYFEITAYGSMHRNMTDAVQFGIVPYVLEFPGLGIGFSTTDVSYFFQEEVIIDPIQNFQGYMTQYGDFFVKFKCVYSPIFSPTVLNGTVLDVSISFVAYEIFGNGTYAQAYLEDTNIRAAVLEYEYSLETAIQIEDSHLLNELHVFAGGTEYDPYSFYFTSPDELILMTDKITGDVLYNDTLVFSDPLIVPIPSKYEFFISYFSTLDKFGFSFDLVDTFVNGTEVNTESVRILSPDAIITVQDFAGEVIENITINKYQNGTYIKIGLDVAQIIVSNQYNYTINFYLTKGSSTIYYQLPGETAIYLRLALGEYRYRVTDTEGNELVDKNVTFTNAQTISIGVLTTDIPILPEFQGITVLDLIVSASIVVGIGITLVVIAYRIGTFSTTSIAGKTNGNGLRGKTKPVANASTGRRGGMFSWSRK